jgi:sucrose-6-phosphate hydrolase SacC (GH32 family)
LPTGQGTHVECGYDSAKGCLFVDRSRSGLDSVDGYCKDYVSPPLEASQPVELRILVDDWSVELFAGDGAVHMSAFVLPDLSSGPLALFAQGHAMFSDVSVLAAR